MTNEEKALLIKYLADAGELYPDGDVETEFLDCRQNREKLVSGEAHYKALLQAVRVNQRSFEDGRKAGLSKEGPAPRLRSDTWEDIEALPSRNTWVKQRNSLG